MLTRATRIDRPRTPPPVLAPARVRAWGAPFGRYRLLEYLGTRDAGEVYRARLDGEGVTKEVALKRLRADAARDRERVSSFIDEARLHLDCAHRSIVQAFEFGQVLGEYFLIRELFPCRPLSSLASRARSAGTALPAHLVVYIAMELCSGLEHLRARRAELHPDLSPENVLVGYEGEVKLADLGPARGGDVALSRLLGLPACFETPRAFRRALAETGAGRYPLLGARDLSTLMKCLFGAPSTKR